MLIHLVLQGLIPLKVHYTPLLSDWLHSRVQVKVVAHDRRIDFLHVEVFLGKHIQVLFEEGRDRFSELVEQIFPELQHLRWFLIVHWEVD